MTKIYIVKVNLKKSSVEGEACINGVYPAGAVYTEKNVPAQIKTEAEDFSDRGTVEVTEVQDVESVKTNIPNRTGTVAAKVEKGKGTNKTKPEVKKDKAKSQNNGKKLTKKLTK